MTMSQRIGWRSYVSPLSSLLTSIYGVWNAETTSTTLATSVYSAWNGEALGTSLDTNLSSIWDGASTLSATNYNTITNSMTHLWKGEGNNSDSVGTSNGTTTGALSYGTGLLGTNAFTFNGSSGVNLPNGALDFTGDFTINMWVKPSAFSTAQLIGSYRNSNVPQTCGWYMGILSTGGVFYNESNGAGSAKGVESSNAIKLNAWSLITLTRTSTAIKLYVNGSLVGTTTSTFSIGYTSSNGFNTIGYQNYGSARFYFNGSIDEVGTWGRELNSTEILALYNSGTGITHPYSVDSTAAMASYGTSNGALTYGTTFTTGKITNGYQFNGSSFVDLPAGSLTKTGNFSFSLWVYPTANPSVEKTLISCHDGIKGWMLQYNASGSLIFFTQPSGGFTLGSSTITLNAWTHIAVSIEAGVTAKIYVNGVLGNSISGIANITYDNYSQYYLPILGAQRYRNPGSVLAEQRAYFTGKIDGVNIWDKVLTESEIVSLYNTGSGAEYPFSSKTLPSPNDAVSTNHGTSPSGSTPAFTTGLIGNAFLFDGVNDYIQLPDNSLNLTGPFSYSFWVKSTDTTGYTVILGNIQGARAPYGFAHGYQVWLQYGKIIPGFRDGADSTNYSATSVATVANGSWNHVVITYNYTIGNSNGGKIYINGTLDSSFTVPNSTNFYSSPMKACIGARNQAGTPEYFLSNGTNLDAVTSWQKELSVDEITQLYNMGGGIQYPFTTQTIKTPYAVYNGDNLIDPIGARNATIVGGVTYSVGKIGNAYTFNGTTGYLTLPVGSLNLAGSFSFSMWLYFNGTPTGYNVIISNTIMENNRGFILSVISGGLIMQLANGSGTWPQIQGPSVSEFTNKWGYVTFVWEQGVGMKFYLNGVLHNSVANTTTLSYTGITAAPMIGKKVDGGWSLLNGSIDGLTFWNSALTAPEVFTLFNDGTGMEYPYSSTLPAKLPSYGDTVNTNHGTSPATSAPTFTTGKFGKAFKFDGVNDHILLPSTALKFTGDFSVSLWVYIPLDSATNQTLIGCLRQPSVWRGWDINIYSNRIYFEAAGATSIKSYAYITSTNIAAWKHVVATFKNGTGGKLYVDNVLRGSFAMTETIVYDSVHTPSIGAMKYAPNTTWYVQNGTKMDAISTWTKELSASEVTDLYNSGNGKQYPNY